MRSILKVSAALSATATLALVTGCGGAAAPGADHKPNPKKTASASPRTSYDPPQKFAAKGIPLPDAAAGNSISLVGTVRKPPPLVLRGTDAYVAAADSLQVIDTSTGTVTSTVRPRNKTIAEKDAETSAPVLTPDGRQALAPFVVEFPGKGTTPSRAGVELDAVDIRTGKVSWTLDLDDLPSWANSPETRARVVAATKSTAVISVAAGEQGATYAVDLGTRKATWHNDEVAAAAVIGDTAVALTSNDSVRQQVIGLDIDHEGKRSWSKLDGYELTVRPAGPRLVAVIGRDYDSGESIGVLLKPDGSKAADLSGDSLGLTCHYDDASVTICQTEKPQVFALDAETGKQLWTLPETSANRVAPTVTVAWHGVVYGTTGNGPVLLDAKTGADRSTSPGAAPIAINEYTGIDVDRENHTLIARPATG